MDKLETMAKLIEIENKIADLNNQRKRLRQTSVDNGWAKWVKVVTTKTPTLAWWKETYPRSWQKYTSKGSRTEFKWK